MCSDINYKEIEMVHLNYLNFLNQLWKELGIKLMAFAQLLRLTCDGGLSKQSTSAHLIYLFI